MFNDYLLSGGRLNIKMLSYQYRDSHVKDKTVSPTVLSLTWESPYLGKTCLYIETGPWPLSYLWHAFTKKNKFIHVLSLSAGSSSDPYSACHCSDACTCICNIWLYWTSCLDGTGPCMQRLNFEPIKSADRTRSGSQNSSDPCCWVMFGFKDHNRESECSWKQRFCPFEKMRNMSCIVHLCHVTTYRWVTARKTQLHC